MRQALLLIAGGLVIGVIGLQAQHLSQATDRADAAEQARDFAEARAALALELVETVADDLETLTPAPEAVGIPPEALQLRAGHIRRSAHILANGDPQLLDPKANPNLLQFFDELL